jgi:V/A-type H+/Na+-transporting ATPase subunit K
MTTQSPSSRAMTRVVWAMSTLVAALVTTLLLRAIPAFAAEAPASAHVIDSTLTGWAFLAAALSTALSALGAGFAVARVGSAAIGAIAEKPELFGRALVLVGLAEGIAIYGLIVSILILNRVA